MGWRPTVQIYSTRFFLNSNFNKRPHMSRLRQSFSWWCFENRGVPARRLLKEAKTIGYHGVDLLPEGLWDQAREAGLIIVNGSGPRPLEKGFNRREHHAPLQER